MTHCSWEAVRPRSAWIDGSATPTMETSRPSRKTMPHSRKSAPQRRASHRGAAGEEEVISTDNTCTRIKCTCNRCTRYHQGVPEDLTDQWRDLLARHARTTV